MIDEWHKDDENQSKQKTERLGDTPWLMGGKLGLARARSISRSTGTVTAAGYVTLLYTLRLARVSHGPLLGSPHGGGGSVCALLSGALAFLFIIHNYVHKIITRNCGII